MNPQKPQPNSANFFNQINQKTNQSISNVFKQSTFQNPFKQVTTNSNQTSITTNAPSSNQPQSGLIIKSAEQQSIASNVTEKTATKVNLHKINGAFSKNNQIFKNNNPAVNAYNTNSGNNPAQAEKNTVPNLAKKSSKKPGQQNQIIVVDQSAPNNSQFINITFNQSTKNNLSSNNQLQAIPQTSLPQNANQTTTTNQNKSYQTIFQNINKSNSSPAQQNNSAILNRDNFGQQNNTGPNINNPTIQNSLDTPFSNKNLSLAGQTPNKPVVSFPFAKSQVNPKQNTNTNLNPNVNIPGVEANKSQSINIMNSLNKNNTTNQFQNNTSSSAFSNFQTNTNTNQNMALSPLAKSTANQNQITLNTNPNQLQNTFYQSSDQNQLPQSANQNFNPQFNQPSINNEVIVHNENRINQHFIPDITSAQYIQKMRFLHMSPSQNKQVLIQKLQQQNENVDIDLNYFFKQCVQNLDYIYEGLEQLSSRPGVLIDQFEQNKILKKKGKQLATTLTVQPHKILTMIKKIENKYSESFICVEKMQSKMEQQIEHQLAPALKDLEKIKQQIDQQALDLPCQAQHELIKIYNHLTSIDNELNQLNETADYYMNLLQK